MTMCDGTGCCAKRDCRRWAGETYWTAVETFEPHAGYQCSFYRARDAQAVPEWVKRVPELKS